MRLEKGSVVVHDASCGLGNACASYLAKKGYRVYGAMAKPDYFQPKADEYFTPIALDPHSGSDPLEAFALAEKDGGPVETLVLCPYRELSGSLEDCDEGQIAEEISLSFLFPVKAIRSALGLMRGNGRGKIILVVDREAAFGIPFHAISTSIHAGLIGLARSARSEAALFGVQVSIIEAAGLRSGLSSRRTAASGWDSGSPYHQWAEKATMARDRPDRFGLDPVLLARLVRAIVEAKSARAAYRIGSLHSRFPVGAFGWYPESLRERWSRSYYGLPERRPGKLVGRR
jgi:NAD(P)-dependent dehydrogenase (short-subunit alcohol dehydrogenase family)